MAASTPALYYPSTIGWVDDNQLFLRTMINSLQNDFAVHPFLNTSECLDYFSTYTPLSDTTLKLRGCVEHDYYDTSNHTLVDFDITALPNIHNNPQRLQEISVLIVDYQMPEMNGVELCQRLKHLPCKKILLTGTADTKAAIAAFNDKIIDCFIQKTSATLNTDLRKHIALLMQAYFNDRTQHLISHLEVNHALPLTDQVFVNFFEDFKKTHDISEYSVMDKQGSLMFLNKKGDASHLVIHTDKSLAAFVDTYSNCQGTQESVSVVQAREKIPFFGIGYEASEREVETWQHYLHTPFILEGREKYYWCEVKSAYEP